MADQRKSLTRPLYFTGALAVGALTLLVYVLLGRVSAAAGSDEPHLDAVPGTLVFLAVAAVGAFAFVRWVVSRLIRPLDVAESVAVRVAGGDLTLAGLPHGAGSGKDGQILLSLGSMVTSLRTLTSAIQGAASEAAAMAEEIAASTQEMTASTQEVASTTGDLTERANQQAAHRPRRRRRRGQDPRHRPGAGGRRHPGGRAERGAGAAGAMAPGAARRQHRPSWPGWPRKSSGGAAEADALAAASEEIEKFVSQTKAIAKQTHMLALNASIEAARAGDEGEASAWWPRKSGSWRDQAAQAATSTSDTVQSVLGRVQTARERLLRLGQGGMAARDAAHAAAEGLARGGRDAEPNDEWTRRISQSAQEVRALIETIAGRMREVSAGTEEYAAAAEQIAAAAQELNASTEEISSSAGHLAEASERLTGAVGGFKLQ